MWRCPYCETNNEDTDNYCMICGKDKNASAEPETLEVKAAAAAVQEAAPAPRPRPSNMWDNGDGIGGAADLKTLAANRTADRSERERKDAEIREKLAGRKPDYEADKRVYSMPPKPVGVPKSNSGGIVAAVIILALIIGVVVFVRYGNKVDIPPAGTGISINSYDVAFMKGPGDEFQAWELLGPDDKPSYLGAIETTGWDDHWCKVSFEGNIGYIDLDYIDFE